ncbi:MAG: transporter substrate-binding domain-containing protein [Deltaproteobacteria bacterium]|jgi:two-component sensor histidine kinase/ABC-type amino acid transport substrate-binding protein|nr:transporter substrate-binding domain-containing protein [Deltaproteobacteria bacterium]
MTLYKTTPWLFLFIIIQSLCFFVASATERNQIIVGVLENWPPQYSYDKTTRKPTGFAVEIMNEVASLSGLRIQYKIFKTWPMLNKALKNREIDVIPNMGITKERMEFFNYTDPVETTNIRFFIRSTSNDIKRIEDMEGRVVSVVDTNKGRFLMEEKAWKNLRIYQSLEEAMMSVLSGVSDVLVYPNPPLHRILNQHGLDDRIIAFGDPLLEIKRGIAVHKDDKSLVDRLNKSVKILFSSAAYKNIHDRYYGNTNTSLISKKTVILITTILGLIILLLFVWRYLSVFKINKILRKTITERKQAEEKIKSSLKEKQTLIDEIHHRVKNNMNVVSSLLKLQANNIKDDKTKDILKESQNRIYAMSAIHETIHGSENLSEISLKTYLYKITNSIFQSSAVNSKKVKLKNDITEMPISINQASPLGLVTNELISNSLKYAFPDEKEGEISVSVKKLDKELELTIEDDGIGLPEEFDLKNSKTLGLKLVRTLVENQLDGSIEMESNDGTKFTIKFNIET